LSAPHISQTLICFSEHQAFVTFNESPVRLVSDENQNFVRKISFFKDASPLLFSVAF
jgi:hypothetical protein